MSVHYSETGFPPFVRFQLMRFSVTMVKYLQMLLQLVQRENLVRAQNTEWVMHRFGSQMEPNLPKNDRRKSCLQLKI